MQAERNKRRGRAFAISAVLVAAVSVFVFVTFPEHHGMLWLALYTIPSHMFVSPFPHEPVLLFYAKTYPAMTCAVVSTIGAVIAGMWDYFLVVPLINHPRLRPKYEKTRVYRRSVIFFRKSAFWALVLLGLTPLPFYPIKFLALADGYPMSRYLLAITIGRTPRYFMIATIGYWLKIPNWMLIAAALVILVFTLYSNRQEFRR
jgi:ribonucleoside-triphosphate reductase